MEQFFEKTFDEVIDANSNTREIVINSSTFVSLLVFVVNAPFIKFLVVVYKLYLSSV